MLNALYYKVYRWKICESTTYTKKLKSSKNIQEVYPIVEKVVGLIIINQGMTVAGGTVTIIADLTHAKF